MADDSGRRPLLNPVLRFTKDPRPEGITGGGKNARGIKQERLAEQRKTLGKQFKELASRKSQLNSFGQKTIVYASMFNDSYAPTWTPSDIFQSDRGAKLIAPYHSGYLIEIDIGRLDYYSALMVTADSDRDMVDISRIESVRDYQTSDVSRGRELGQMWEEAPDVDGGKAFLLWLMPFDTNIATEAVLTRFGELRQQTIQPPLPLLSELQAGDDAETSVTLRRTLRSISQTGDRFSAAMREYRQKHRAKTVAIVPSLESLVQLTASGAIFRIEPVQPITSTSPGEGKEPDRPLPADISSMPIVGVVDGGLTATSYKAAEAWKAPPLVKDGHANGKHGNRVTSLIVQGHDWNNKLKLPPLYCQVGTVQAVAKIGAGPMIDPQTFIAYLDAVMGANPDTKVWNFSLNQKMPCDPESVSELGHEISMLARKHKILPVISIGNKPGDRLEPPADCEAALTIGGRMHTEDGSPGGNCTVSHFGPGPSCMLKPEMANFSHVRAIGGTLTQGSSFATALTSPLAAHTMEHLREPSPDLVKALLIHHADGQGFDPAIGFGSSSATLPWQCPPGFVTLQWTASLKAGAAYYWELPIPEALKNTGKLRGFGSLTAILNPHPLVSEYAGPNYFSARLATALQYPKGDKFSNLLGSLDTGKITEEEARAVDHKWSPIRHHHKQFHGIGFDGDNFKVYARIYTRDLYLYDYTHADETPEMDVEFVLSIGTGNEDDDVYHQMHDALGSYVENATIDAEVEIENME